MAAQGLAGLERTFTGPRRTPWTISNSFRLSQDISQAADIVAPVHGLPEKEFLFRHADGSAAGITHVQIPFVPIEPQPGVFFSWYCLANS